MDESVRTLIGIWAIAVVVGFGIFLIVRQLLLWYWKVNEQIILLQRIAVGIEKLAGIETTDDTPQRLSTLSGNGEVNEAGERICQYCRIPLNAKGECPTCGVKG